MKREKDPRAVPAQIADVMIFVTCQCGDLSPHAVACVEDDYGTWAAAPHDRFVLCDTCETLIDTGLRVTVAQPK